MNEKYLKNPEFFSKINYLLFKADIYRAIFIIKLFLINISLTGKQQVHLFK
jgi:hypothetical protein